MRARRLIASDVKIAIGTPRVTDEFCFVVAVGGSKTMASQKLLGLITGFAVLSSGISAFAQGTDQQRDACTPDAFRLCGQFIPDAERVAACLKNAGPKLSPACYVVFNPPRDDSSQRSARRRYVPPPQSPPPSWNDDDNDDD
jgi:hypothetical protein